MLTKAVLDLIELFQSLEAKRCTKNLTSTSYSRWISLIKQLIIFDWQNHNERHCPWFIRLEFDTSLFGKETTFEFDWIWLNSSSSRKFDGYSILLQWKILTVKDVCKIHWGALVLNLFSCKSNFQSKNLVECIPSIIYGCLILLVWKTVD